VTPAPLGKSTNFEPFLQRKCQTKLSIFFKSTDIFADDFLRVENFKAGKLEKYDPYATLIEWPDTNRGALLSVQTAPINGTDHLKTCADDNAWKNAVKKYCDARMKENRTSTKLKQWQVREEIIKDCELNEEFAKELFTLEMNKKFSEVSKRFADKIEVGLESQKKK